MNLTIRDESITRTVYQRKEHKVCITFYVVAVIKKRNEDLQRLRRSPVIPVMNDGRYWY
jgi:hypothetical protein